MTRNEAAYTGEVGSMQFSHFLQIYGKLYSLKYDGACRSKGPVHGYEAIRLKQIYKNRFIERREHASIPRAAAQLGNRTATRRKQISRISDNPRK